MAQFYTIEFIDGLRLLMEVAYVESDGSLIEIGADWRATLQ